MGEVFVRVKIQSLANKDQNGCKTSSFSSSIFPNFLMDVFLPRKNTSKIEVVRWLHNLERWVALPDTQLPEVHSTTLEICFHFLDGSLVVDSMVKTAMIYM